MSDVDRPVSQEDRELYRYGYKLLIMQAANIAVAVVIGVAFSCLKEMFLFLMAFIPLRSYAGGYHAGGPFACGILSAGMELAVAAGLTFLRSPLMANIMLFSAILCEIVIYALAPVAAENKPLSTAQRVLFRKKARVILGVEMMLLFVFYAAGIRTLMMTTAMSHILAAMLLAGGKIAEILSVKGE